MYSETVAAYIGQIILLVLLKDKLNLPKNKNEAFFNIDR